MGDVYTSSVLTTDMEDDCLVCRFVRGERSPDVLLATIKALDVALAREESEAKEILRKLAERVASNG